ncbi:hypothetical protein TPA0909_06600 [Streptomyces albus]|nr:hypothetical protein TPA0909_06600 [Streptomyces albus]
MPWTKPPLPAAARVRVRNMPVNEEPLRHRSAEMLKDPRYLRAVQMVDSEINRFLPAAESPRAARSPKSRPRRWH